MTVYEMRTYTLHVGKMGEAVKLYRHPGGQAADRRAVGPASLSAVVAVV